MATSIASQLQALKSFAQVDTESTKRPITRPSILLDAKKAADTDLDTLLTNALAGLEVLVNIDSRFGGYKNSLFSWKGRDLDRELVNVEENRKIDESIKSYLRLLSGYLQEQSALKTLEYLIRRYKVHVYNIDELVLCALPYHDTHEFVRIIGLLELRNSMWGFLKGVQGSGARPPRMVIVQQCKCDMGLLEALCRYALPVKKYQASIPVVNFVTAVVVEVLGSLSTIDNNTVRKVLPFVLSGLEPTAKSGSHLKAGALMVVGTLANRVEFDPKHVKTLIESIAKVARQDAKESADMPWLRNLLMTIISLVQSQSIHMFPKKALEILNEIRDFTGVLMGLSKDFNIKTFLSVYLKSLVNYSSSDEFCLKLLISTIETVAVKDFIDLIVTNVLTSCMMLSKKIDKSKLCESGFWAKRVLVVIDKNHPTELRGAIRKFQKESVTTTKEDSIFETLVIMLDGSLDSSPQITDTKIWFSLEHPKADVRRATLISMGKLGLLNSEAVGSQKLVAIQEAIARRLHDDDLSVVRAALSLNDLCRIISTPNLLEAFRAIFRRCTDIFTSSPHMSSDACDVALSCLNSAMILSQDQHQYKKEIASMIFPLILAVPKTWRLNVKVLELAKDIKWPFYQNISCSYDLISKLSEKKVEPSFITSINIKSIGVLAETFSTSPHEYVPWLLECSSDVEMSKTLFFLVMLQSFMMQKEDHVSYSALFQACFPVLKQEWNDLESCCDSMSAEEFNVEHLGKDCGTILDDLLSSTSKVVNRKLLVCIFWRLLESFVSTAQLDASAVIMSALHDMFVFFSASRLKHVFREHFHVIVMKCNISPVGFLSKYFTEEGVPVVVQVESLLSVATISSQFASSEKSIRKSQLQLLLGFSSVLVPLSSANQDIRAAAMECIEGLYTLWEHMEKSGGKNGSDAMLPQSVWTPIGEFLQIIIRQKRLILSDREFLPSFLTSVLGPSCHSLVAPQDVVLRFDDHKKESILHFVLGQALNLSAYGKHAIFSLLVKMRSSVMLVDGVKDLLSKLLERRSQYHFGINKSSQALSSIEIKTLCFLLECSMVPADSLDGNIKSDYLMKALQVDNVCSEDPAVLQPCVTVLKNLNDSLYKSLKIEIQEPLFHNLVYLFHNDNGDIQNAARDALLQINIACSTISHLLESILAREGCVAGLSNKKKKKKLMKEHNDNIPYDSFFIEENLVSFLSSLLDVLLLKKDVVNRASLIGPLFKLLKKVFTEEWLLGFVGQDERRIGASSGVSQSIGSAISYIQQSVLLVIEDISTSLISDITMEDNKLNQIDIKLLVDCAHAAKDAITRNHVFTLLSSISKVTPESILDHMVDIITVIGESAVTQCDTHSQRVFEELISTLVPFWLSRTENTEKLLQIFIDVLPKVAEHRRTSIIVYLLRVLGEKKSLASVLGLLIRSLVSKICRSCSEANMLEFPASLIRGEWEYLFSVQLCEQYSCMIWLPSLVMLLQQIRMSNKSQEQLAEIFVAMQFVLFKLGATELVFKLESGEDSEYIQRSLEELMEQVVSHLRLVNARGKKPNVNGLRKELKECIHSVLKTITKAMIPSAYFEGITLLLGHEDGAVKKKALGLLCETVKDHATIKPKRKEKSKQKFACTLLHLDESSWESFGNMCSKTNQIIESPDSDTQVKVAAVSALEVLANKYPSNDAIFVSCLRSVAKNIASQDLAVSSSCLRTTGALVSALGPKALPELPHIMEYMLKKAHAVSCIKHKHGHEKSVIVGSGLKESILLSVLVTLEAVVDKLGFFLNPYLEDVIELMVLRSEYASGSDPKIKVKADAVRRLISEKIPVRLTISPLLKLYPKAVKSGESSLSVAFEMLATLIGTMDRSSIGSYHAKIFEQCLLALDLRRENPASLKSVGAVEDSVIHAMITLTMKLTEPMFKPLFIRSLEWAESELDGVGSTQSPNVDRTISFFRLINKLAEHHRSLFVPYFKFLLEGCIQYLTNDVQSAGLNQKKKKAKIEKAAGNTKEERETPKRWHLKALVISSLHKCFMYDTGSLKFLDSSNFQALLKPIVSQLVAEPPSSLEEFPDIPSLEEVNDSLVICLGQMAVTAGSDLLWKPLNHEVLMQTRNEKVRSRILGLRVVKYLVEHLKEEYLVFLPETIPFLGELLEDVELPVKSLAQEILKEMENMSGESLRQYL